MARSAKPAASRARRIAPTRPSIMSEGAITWAPARAWETAIRASSSRVGSFCTSPPATTPQWPCEVYSHRQTSVITRSSRHSERMAATAFCTTPSSA